MLDREVLIVDEEKALDKVQKIVDELR